LERDVSRVGQARNCNQMSEAKRRSKVVGV
jgi:hypothetical protein